MKQTKEQLQKENAELNVKLHDLLQLDDEQRKNFSMVLGAPINASGFYGDDKKQHVYSWAEIFTEVGKLLGRQNQRHLEEMVNDHELKLSDLDQRLRRKGDGESSIHA